MEEDATIVEQEVNEAARLLTDSVVLAARWLDDTILSVGSVYQIVGLVACLVVAWLLRRRFERFLTGLSTTRSLGPVVQRLMLTLAAVSLPLAWAILLYLAEPVYTSLGLSVVWFRLAGSLLAAFIVIRIFAAFIPSAYWSQVFAWGAWSVAALNVVGLLDPIIEWLRATVVTLGPVTISAWTVVKGIALTALLIWLAQAIAQAVERRLEANDTLNAALRLLTTRIVHLVLIVLAVVIGLSAVGVDLTAFAVFSGAVGLGIGLGLRGAVENLLAGYTLLAGQSIKPRDVIEIETAFGPTYGQVIQMTTRHVAVRTRDGTVTLIPNAIIAASPLTNWTHSGTLTRRKIPVGIDYGSDVELARQLCLEAAAEVARVQDAPAPVCLMRGFGDSAIDLELRFWITDPENGVNNVASDILLKIWEKFRAHGIKVPFPQRDVHLRSALPAADAGPEAPVGPLA
jgi:small-conductance mechanosensitive channel